MGKEREESKMTVLLFALTMQKVSHWRLRVTDKIVSVPVSPVCTGKTGVQLE